MPEECNSVFLITIPVPRNNLVCGITEPEGFVIESIKISIKIPAPCRGTEECNSVFLITIPVSRNNPVVGLPNLKDLS